MVPGAAKSTASDSEPVLGITDRFPCSAQALVLLFPVLTTLAAIAARWYFGIALPGHLRRGAGEAP